MNDENNKSIFCYGYLLLKQYILFIVIFILTSFCNVDIQHNTYYSFSMICSNKSRFIDIKDLAFIEIYVVFNKTE